MNGIFGMGELLLDTKLSTEQCEFVEAIINCAHSVLCIVNDILDFSKIEAGKLGEQPSNLLRYSLMSQQEDGQPFQHHKHQKNQ